MRVGICDFPSRYEFPPRGYGGIERWLWSVAAGARSWGAEVTLIGAGWRRDLPADFVRFPTRLEDCRDEQRLLALDMDLLVVGHEYPSLPAWRRAWSRIGCDVATFQHDPTFQHPQGTFDGKSVRLYCYSPEMVHRYAVHRPSRELSVQVGFDEDPPPATSGTDLLWLGRICAAKAPHLAARAADLLGRRLRIVGPIHEPDYVRAHARWFDSPLIEWVGELGGRHKATALQQAGTLVYTAARPYVEAGAAIFGDALRAGTPVAALAWREGTCAQAALCADTGAIAALNADDDDAAASERLAQAICEADALDARHVQAIGLERFDPVHHFAALARRS